MNLQHLHDIPNLHFMPVRSNKLPIFKGWQESEVKHSLENCEAVGLVCGSLSGNLEVIDVDCKYDLTGNLFENLKKAIHNADPNLLVKLVVQKTISGGFHILYRCEKIEGNLKLANRHTTKEEKDKTYNETYKNELKKSTDDTKAKEVAQKASKNDKVRVLLETRGEGGYIMCFPSAGYEMIYGDFYSISEISVEERETLHSISRQFNQVLAEAPPVKSHTKTKEGLSSFEDYNQNGDVCTLLQNHGWRIVGTKGAKTVFLRPGQTTSHSSGNFDKDKNWFSVFTTSTEFEPCKAYLPYAVYAILECGGDFSEASKRLFDLGYGEKKSKDEKPSTRIIQSRIDPQVEDFSKFAIPADYDEYLSQVRNGTLQMGLTTGIPSLDKHFLLKPASFVHINGIDNVGKSEVIWYLGLLAAMYHGWKGIIFSSENTVGAFVRRMIQFYWSKPLHGNFAMSEKEYEEARNFVQKHFLIIKAQEDLYNYKDIINLIKIGLKKEKYMYGVIDPYNSLKIDLSGFSKLNTHEYHYEALSELKSFGQQTGFGWFVNHHAVTSALRLKDADKKYQLAPRKEDTEQGGKVANKADDFLTIHRITQHPTDWMITEIHVRKIKDTETGGRPTPLDEPVRLERYKGGYAYVEIDQNRERCIDPVYEWQVKRGVYQQSSIGFSVNHKWTPIENGDIGF